MTQWGATEEEWLHFAGTLKLREHLLPVVSNPNAKISPKSTIKSPGKIPSVYNAQGFLTGISKWTEHKSTIEEIKKWMKQPDYGICIQCRYIRALDCDIESSELADKIIKFLIDKGINLPARGRENSRKFLLAFRMEGDFNKRTMLLKGGLPGDKIEFLANGQQFIALGTHPKGDRYEWAGGLPEEIPECLPSAFEELWQALVAEFGVDISQKGDYSPRNAAGETYIGNDPIMSWLEKQGSVTGYSDEGAAYITCPFKSGHSREGDKTETIYFPAGLRGYDQGHFNCLHASCSGRSDEEFQDAIGYRAAQFEDLGPLPAAENKPLKYQFIPAEDYANRPPPEWIIQDILPRGELALLFGESGSGKSFLAIDIAMAIARGADWNGHPVKQGNTAYICAEGSGAMRNRLRAYIGHHGGDLKGLSLLPASPNLLETGEAAEITKGLLALGKIDVFFVDTLAQTTPGDEDAEAFKKAIANCKKISQATSAMAVLIHHPGKDLSKGLRGSSVLHGAADCIMEVSRVENSRFIKIIKQKDGEEGQEWGVNLITVNIDMDNEGRVMSSCAVEYVNGAKRKIKQKQRGSNEKAVIKAFDELGGMSCSMADLITKALEFIPKDPEKRDQRRRDIMRAITSLDTDGVFKASAEKVQIPL